jgi:hypothetical protein
MASVKLAGRLCRMTLSPSFGHRGFAGLRGFTETP